MSFVAESYFVFHSLHLLYCMFKEIFPIICKPYPKKIEKKRRLQ